uniref:Uncharacterized protein n=1 Tax=Arundo donax TaxID=35708 RepID=A0A0A9B987_ARUDO
MGEVDDHQRKTRRL